VATQRQVRIGDLQQAKQDGRRWAMLTSYDVQTAGIFDRAGVSALLVGDSAANTVYGYPTTASVTTEELLPLARAVADATERALVVADLPFGSYEASPTQALATTVRFVKQAGVAAIKLEGGVAVADQIAKITAAGVPVMGHVGYTPQSEHQLSGHRVQGRGGAAEQLVTDAHAVADAGAFAVVLEMVPADLAARITRELAIPTIGIGAGPDCDAQVLVWQDMAGLTAGRVPRFVKKYADLASVLSDAATQYVTEVAEGTFPAEEHSFQ
jgi:3-methyl-2-oxobutanoate hydroxymethyltransferase